MDLTHPDPPAANASSRVIETLVVFMAAFVIAILMWSVAIALDLEPMIATLLPWLAGAATLAGAAALGVWRAQWLGDRTRPLVWILLRLVIVAFAIVALVGVSIRGANSGCQPTHPGEGDGVGGALLHARVVGDTVVCNYEYGGGGL